MGNKFKIINLIDKSCHKTSHEAIVVMDIPCDDVDKIDQCWDSAAAQSLEQFILCDFECTLVLCSMGAYYWNKILTHFIILF